MMLLTCMFVISDPFIALNLLSLFLRFTPADSDANWIESLSRANVPHSTVSNALSTNAPTSSGQAESLQSQVTSLQTTIASVQSENTSLRSSLSRLEALEAGMSVYGFMPVESYSLSQAPKLS